MSISAKSVLINTWIVLTVIDTLNNLLGMLKNNNFGFLATFIDPDTISSIPVMGIPTWVTVVLAIGMAYIVYSGIIEYHENKKKAEASRIKRYDPLTSKVGIYFQDLPVNRCAIAQDVQAFLKEYSLYDVKRSIIILKNDGVIEDIGTHNKSQEPIYQITDKGMKIERED